VRARERGKKREGKGHSGGMEEGESQRARAPFDAESWPDAESLSEPESLSLPPDPESLSFPLLLALFNELL
jgi:hypothetical protein